MVLFLRLIIILFITFGCDGKVIQQPQPLIKGVNLEGPRQPFGPGEFEPLQKTGFSWVAVVPYAYMHPDSTFVRWEIKGRKYWYWGESEEGITQIVQMAHKEGLKVMLKPHLWVKGYGWAGELRFPSEKWDEWEQNYREYLLAYVTMADTLGVEMVCIGTEIRHSASERPVFWRNLIREIRELYFGKLTYAANWDNYQHISFWPELDYVGIDAYFPLHTAARPSEETLVNAWLPINNRIARLSKQLNKPVLFTEFGYRSIIYTTGEHYKMEEIYLETDMQAQAVAYKALFKAVTREPWYAGGFLWKWSIPHQSAGGIRNDLFTPQNKPAQQIIRQFNTSGISPAEE